MIELILLGGGGHSRSCIDVIELQGKYRIIGILDCPEKVGEKILGYDFVGTDDDIKKFTNLNCHFLITVGHLGKSGIRNALWKTLVKFQSKMATIISPRAYVSKHAIIEPGSIVLHDALINAGARVGSNCIINTKALIEHDAVIEHNVHVSTAAVVNGGVLVRKNSFIGSNAVTKQAIEIGENTFIKAGSVVK